MVDEEMLYIKERKRERGRERGREREPFPTPYPRIVDRKMTNRIKNNPRTRQHNKRENNTTTAPWILTNKQHECKNQNGILDEFYFLGKAIANNNDDTIKVI